MNNLEKITEPWKWGWSAVLDYGENSAHVVFVSEKGTVGILYNDDILQFEPECSLKNAKIIGYKYAGELAGNEPIPEGQKFRVKGGDEIMVYNKEHLTNIGRVSLKLIKEAKAGRVYTTQFYHESEIEPFWD